MSIYEYFWLRLAKTSVWVTCCDDTSNTDPKFDYQQKIGSNPDVFDFTQGDVDSVSTMLAKSYEFSITIKKSSTKQQDLQQKCHGFTWCIVQLDTLRLPFLHGRFQHSAHHLVGSRFAIGKSGRHLAQKKQMLQMDLEYQLHVLGLFPW